MPHWDFKCIGPCGEIQNLYFSNWRDATASTHRCPLCGGELVKLMAAPNFMLIGSGFHSVDYPKNKK